MESSNSKYIIKISDATKDGEIVKFTVQTKTTESESSESGKIVLRQYEDFEYLLHCITTRNVITSVVLPSLPPRPIVAPADSESKVKFKPTPTGRVTGDGYYMDCKRLQKFLQDIADHPLFLNDDHLEKFLTDEEPPVRASVKKSLIDSFASIVDTARFHHYKDVDEEFQNRRDNTNLLLARMKSCNECETKMITAENRLSTQLGNVAMSCRNSATIDIQQSKIITRFLNQFSDVLDELQMKNEKASHITEDTLGFSLELYSRKLLACQDMLFRRTCRMVEQDNASKALDKAKPKNREQLLSAKEESVRVFDEVSGKSKDEFDKFTESRIEHFQLSLVGLAERQIEHHQETCDLLSKAIHELNAVMV